MIMNQSEKRNLYIDRPELYRWVIVIAGIFGLFACLGIGRFALGMMLPAMGKSLQLSYSQMGVVGTLNFCGYLGAVLFCGRLIRRFGARTLIAAALLLVGGSMVMIGFATNFVVITILYLLTGVGSALSNVPIIALIATWFEPAVRGRAAGMVVIGNGLGIIMAGYLVPIFNGSDHGWRLSWFVLGVTAIGTAGICWMLIRNRPSTGYGSGVKAKEPDHGCQPDRRTKLGSGVFAHCALIYFLFGCTYVVYVTFFVTSLVQERYLSEYEAGLLWAWVGWLSLGSGPLFGYLSDRFSRRAALSGVFCIQAIAYASAATFLPETFLYLSIFCFGIVAWSIPTIMAALIGDLAGPERTAAVFGFVTFIFGIGQISGPYGAGLLAELSGGFSASFLVAALLALGAAFLSARLPGKDSLIQR
jgi:MFS family permease